MGGGEKGPKKSFFTKKSKAAISYPAHSKNLRSEALRAKSRGVKRLFWGNPLVKAAGPDFRGLEMGREKIKTGAGFYPLIY